MNAKQLNRKKGQGMTEYIVILGIVVALLLAFSTIFKPQISGAISAITSEINNIIP